jgi:hypothetical protein
MNKENKKDLHMGLKVDKADIRLHTVLFVLLVLFCGCAHHKKIPSEPFLTVYAAPDGSDSLLIKYAPLFLSYDFQKPYNRIGKPEARKGEDGKINIFVNTEKPVIYTLKRTFSTSRGSYTNLIYRVHFPKVPFSLIPFNLTMGNNVGLMVIITLDYRSNPVLVSTVHTCGCYLAIIPATSLPKSALPECWKEEAINVYGEVLPSVLDFRNKENSRLLVHLRPQVHRVMDLEIIDDQVIEVSPSFRIISTPLVPVEKLKELSINEDTISFFYESGFLKGYVRGSIKPWETMFLSMISMDLFVGTDKAYDDPLKTGNPFYTSLKPWNRNKSNMWYFADFLEFWGWDL